jgi:NAD(P)-dependent dehydrogenase (short-subunit alcohol dehydrogenase family)
MVALVTGASKGGSGTGLAVRLAAQGAKVGISARSVDGLEKTREMVEAVGSEALVLPCDFGDPDGGRDTLVAQTEEAFGPLDILVNEPVSHDLKRVEEFTLPELRQHFELNVMAYWLTMSQVIPGMRERGRGWILNFTSFSGELPPGPPWAFKALDGSSMYGATKAAVNRMTVSAAAENHGIIAVNAVTPQCAMGNALNSPHMATLDIWEPVETMVEAAYALCTGDPNVLTGRIAYSLQLIVELDLEVHDFTGKDLIDDWQIPTIIKKIKGTEKFHLDNNNPGAFDYHRPHTPYPDALRI